MLTTLFLSLVLSFAPATDTVTFYSIDQSATHSFDGNRLVGKTVESYQVDTVRDENNVYIFHIIKTLKNQEEGQVKTRGVARPVYIVDDKVVDEKRFHSLDTKSLSHINVYHPMSASEVAKKYGVDGSGGIVVIFTKSYKEK